jgi:CO dehydrogenase maturation factor
MKIAISGKGGVGKTTVAALLARAIVRQGNRVIAIDADPDANLAASLGHDAPDSIKPLVTYKDLINERVGTGGVIRLNPRVDDLLDTIAVDIDGIKLMVLGTIPRGGGGCFCSPSALLKALMLHVLAQSDEWVILDMEAGLEHLGRGSSGGIDSLLVVVEPSRRSIETARRIQALAADIGIPRVLVVANKTSGEAEIRFIRESLSPLPVIGAVPRSPSLEGFGARVDDASVDTTVITSVNAILDSMHPHP